MSDDDARRFVDGLNIGDAGKLQEFAARVRSDPRFLAVCGGFSAAVVRSEGDGGQGFPADLRGARAVVGVIEQHPAFREDRPLRFAAPVFGVQGGDPGEIDATRETAEFVAAGLSALGLTGTADPRRIGALVAVAAGPDAFSRLTRDIVLGGLPRGLDLDLNGLIPPGLIDIEALGRRICTVSIDRAAQRLAQSFNFGRAWETGITSLDPPAGCPGDTVVIRGAGFGANQSAGTTVRFPRQSSGCLEAQITGWSDTAVTVVVPAGVGPGCVGFAEVGTPPDFEAAATLAGEMERCIGPGAGPIADKIRRLGTLMPPAPCPSCLPGGANRFTGGGPTVDSFVATSGLAGGIDISVEPGQPVVLTWATRNASTLTLARITPGGPFVAPPSPLPASGSLDLGPFTGSSPASAAYRLTATSACGSIDRTVTVRLMRVPRLTVAAIEVVQVIQRPDNSVRLAAGKRTVARVFVDSGVTDGFDYGGGPGFVIHLTGSITVYPLGRGFGTSGTALNAGIALAVPAGARDRNDPRHSLTFELPTAELNGPVRIDADVVVNAHQADLGGPWKASASTGVIFLPRPHQEVLPFLVTDRRWRLPAPGMPALGASVQEARKRFPLAETGFTLNMPIAWVAGFGAISYDLANASEWGLLLTNIMATAFVFPKTPVGGVRTALVPNNPGGLVDAAGAPIPGYGVNGMALPRVGAFPPTMVAQAGLTGTYAHEFGHCIGLGHAPCPAPPGTPGTGDCSDPPDGIDPRLPGRTDEVGFDVPAGAVIETSRGELMSYCGDTSRCPGPTRWPSIASWDLLFDTLPV